MSDRYIIKHEHNGDEFQYSNHNNVVDTETNEIVSSTFDFRSANLINIYMNEADKRANM